MLNNVTELLHQYNTLSFDAFARTREFDQNRFGRFSFGLTINDKDVYSNFNEHKLGEATTLIISSSRDESDLYDRCERFDFPLQNNFLETYTSEVTKNNLRETIIERYGECSETGLDIIEQWIEFSKIESALIYGVTAEELPETLEYCNYQPEYEDGNWVENWIGIGISIGNDGIYGVISTYDGDDWDNQYHSLLHGSCVADFKETCQSIETPWDESEYLEWCYEQRIAKDPLDYFNVPSTVCRDCTIHFSKTNNGFSFDKVEIFHPDSDVRDLSLEAVLSSDIHYALDEFSSELKKTPGIRNTGINTLTFQDDIIDFFNESNPSMKVGESDVAKVNGRVFNIPKERLNQKLKSTIKKKYLPVKPVLKFQEITSLVKWERERQKELAHGGNTDDFDKTLSENDFIALANSYLGRAVQKSFRNQREGQDYRENIIKAIAILYSSLECPKSALFNRDIVKSNEDKIC